MEEALYLWQMLLLDWGWQLELQQRVQEPTVVKAEAQVSVVEQQLEQVAGLEAEPPYSWAPMSQAVPDGRLAPK